MPRVTLPPYPQPPPKRGQRPRPRRKPLRLPAPDRPPRFPAPKGYIGGWATNPGLNKNRFKTIKTGKGYFIAKPIKPVPKGKGRVTTPPKPKTPPAPPPGPYDKYPEWARQSLTAMDADAAREQAFGLDVQKWLTGALAPIQAAGQASSQNYRSSMAQIPQGNVGVPNIPGMVGGLSTTATSPDAWKTDAANVAQRGYSQIAQGESAIASFLNDAKIGNLRSALETNLAQDLLRLGESRKKEKMAYLSKLDQFMAESEAEAAQSRAELAQKTTNDWYDFVAQLTNAGVRLTDINLDASALPKGSGGIFVPGAQKPPDVPGKQWVKEPGGWRAIDLPTPPKPSKPPKPVQPKGVRGPFDTRPPKVAGWRIFKQYGKWYREKIDGGAGTGGGGGGLTPSERRQQYKDSSDIWKGKPPNNTLGTGGEPGLSTARVNGWTHEDGTMALPGADNQRYVFNVRAYRFLEQVLSMTGDKKRAEVILSGILTRRNYIRFRNWYLSNDRGDLSFYAAKKRRHV